MLEGSHVQQYAALWDYDEELNRVNPESTVVIKSDLDGDRPRFQRMYTFLATCKQGWLEGCRPLIRLYRCHIKGPHPGNF